MYGFLYSLYTSKYRIFGWYFCCSYVIVFVVLAVVFIELQFLLCSFLRFLFLLFLYSWFLVLVYCIVAIFDVIVHS
jgi:hypothetical protein